VDELGRSWAELDRARMRQASGSLSSRATQERPSNEFRRSRTIPATPGRRPSADRPRGQRRRLANEEKEEGEEGEEEGEEEEEEEEEEKEDEKAEEGAAGIDGYPRRKTPRSIRHRSTAGHSIDHSVTGNENKQESKNKQKKKRN